MLCPWLVRRSPHRDAKAKKTQVAWGPLRAGTEGQVLPMKKLLALSIAALVSAACGGRSSLQPEEIIYLYPEGGAPSPVDTTDAGFIAQLPDGGRVLVLPDGGEIPLPPGGQ